MLRVLSELVHQGTIVGFQNEKPFSNAIRSMPVRSSGERGGVVSQWRM